MLKKIKVKKFLLYLWQKHKIMFFALIVSAILSVIPCIIVFTDINLSVYEKLIGLLFLIPLLIVILITYIATKTSDKYPKLTKFVTFLIINFIIIYIQLIWGMYFLFFIGLASLGKIYDSPSEYLKAIKTINNIECISHFPSSIPLEAKNIELNKETNAWFGSEAIILKFSIDKNYIQNELNKYKYVYVDKPSNYSHDFKDAMLTNNGRIKIKDYTFYIINDKEHDKSREHHFPYHCGIGVNKEMNSIIYYYVNPD